MCSFATFARLLSAANGAEPNSSHFFINASDPDTDAARQGYLVLMPFKSTSIVEKVDSITNRQINSLLTERHAGSAVRLFKMDSTS
jgi:hypothetical protein